MDVSTPFCSESMEIEKAGAGLWGVNIVKVMQSEAKSFYCGCPTCKVKVTNYVQRF